MAIYKRSGSKYYWFKFYFDGELIQRSSKCTNKTDARTVESAYRTQLALGKVGIKPKIKAIRFDEAIGDFLKWSKVNHSESSGKRYAFACKSLKQFFGKTKTDKIKKKDVEKFIEWRLNQKSRKTGKFITRGTVNRDVMILKQIFRRLVEENLLDSNPSLNIKYLPENDQTFHVITRAEESAYTLAASHYKIFSM